MSKLLDRFRYFKQKGETFCQRPRPVYNNNRDWEDSYRQRWQFDKIVRSTHGVNCTGSCSWKIYVKNGLVTGNPADRLSAHPARSAKPRTARLPAWRQLLWYLYSANRLKYPLARKRLIELWREAWRSIPTRCWHGIASCRIRQKPAAIKRRAAKAVLSAPAGKS